MGASASFFIGWIATADDPEALLKLGFFVSAVALTVLVLLELVFGPWVRVGVTPVKHLDEGAILLQLAMRQAGRREFGRTIVNVFVPASERLTVPEGEPGAIASAPEEILVPGIRGSAYWNHMVHFVPGTQMFHVVVRLDPKSDPAALPMRARVGSPRRDLTVDTTFLGVETHADFGSIRPRLALWVIGRWTRLRRLGG